MRYLILLFAVLSIASCKCPEIVVGTKESRDTTTTTVRSVDTSTVSVVDTSNIAPVVFSGELNLDSICQELYRMRKDSDTVAIVIDATPISRPRGGGSIGLTINSTGKAVVDCKTDSLYKVINSLTTTISIQDSTIQKISHSKETTYKVEVPVKDWWYKTYRALAWIFIGLIIIIIIAKWAGKITGM